MSESGPQLSTSEILSRARQQGATTKPEDLSCSREDTPLPPLIQASVDGDLVGVTNALANGADVDETDAHGMTALSFSLRRGDLTIAHFLVERGANVNVTDGRIPALHDAVAIGDMGLIQMILERGADIQVQDRETGDSVLMRAQSEEVIRLLVQRGASIEMRNRVGHDAIDEHRYQATAIRRHEEQRRNYYAKLKEMTNDNPQLQVTLLSGLDNLSQEPRARNHESLALLLEQLQN